MIFPILFGKNETDFFNNGLGPVKTFVNATVTEERNGSFYFEGTVVIDEVIYPNLKEDNIIRCDAANNLKDQRFRIKRIVDKHDGTAEIYAEHISYELNELALKPEVTVTSADGNSALNIWKNSIIDKNDFVVSSDIQTVQSTSWRIDKVENARMALGGVEGSILSKWGGEFKFDNYDIQLLQKRGATANVLLAYGRNITDFEQERNITETFTSVYPYAIKRGEGEDDTEELITIPGYFVDSENLDKFPNRKAKPVDFSNEFKDDEPITTEKLTSLAEKYVKNNQYGVPKVSIKVSFLDLSQTADYAEFAPLESLNLCDDVRVVYPKLGVDTISKVIKTVWDVLSDRYESIEIGQKRVSLSTVINDTVQKIDEVESQTNFALKSADGKNTIFYGLYGENGTGEPKANKIGDMWYKPNGEFTEFYQWDGTVWKLIMSTGDIDAVKKEVEKAQEDIKEADRVANSAANQAASNAESITDLEKVTDDIISDANKVKDDLSTTKENLLEVKSQAEKGIADAKDVLKKVNGVETDLTTEVTRIDGQLATKVAQTEYDSLKGTVTSQGTAIEQNASEIALKASQTEVNTLTNKVNNNETAITQNANAIKLKADSKTVDTLSGKVTSNAGAIDVLNNGIKLKADKTELNTLSGTVNSLSSDLSVEAGKISGLVTKTDGHTTEIGKLKLASDEFTTTFAEVKGDIASNVDKLSQHKQTIEAIQGTVKDKADQSQVTQMASQITSIVAGSGYSNLLKNTDFKDRDLNFWVKSGPWYHTNTGYSVYKGSDGIGINTADNSKDFWYWFGQDVKATAGTVISGSVNLIIYNDIPSSSNILKFAFYEENGKYISAREIAANNSLKDQRQLLKLENITAPKKTSYVSFQFIQKNSGHVTFNQPMLCYGNKVGTYASGTISQSQITQLKNDINLRVEKGDLISQINLEAGRTLIQSKKILLDAETVVFSGKAFIPSAAITDLNADKITSGTINGANVNVINLNAGNITSGYLNTDRIASRSITASKIKAGEITANEIASGTITANEIASNTITSNEIKAGAITANDIRTGTLESILIKGPNLTIDLNSGYMETWSGSRSTQFKTGQIEFEDGINETKILRAQGDGLVVRSDGYSDNVGLRLVGNGSSFLDFYKGKNESEYARFQLIDGSGGDDGLFLLDLKQSPGDEFGVQFSGMPGPARYSGSNRYFKMAYGGIMAYLYNNGASSMVGISDSSNPNSYLPIWASRFKQDSNREEKEDIKPVGQTGVTTVKNLKIYDYVRKNNKSKQVGLMVDEAPKAITDGEGIDLYSFISTVAQAVKEQQAQISDLSERIAMLGGY